MDDYLKNSALSRVLDSYREMEKMRRALSPLYDDLRSPIERLTQIGEDVRNNFTQVGKAMESIAASLQRASFLDTIERFRRIGEENLVSQQLLDKQMRLSQDLARRFADVATPYHDAFRRIEQVERSIAQSVYQPIYSDTMRDALAVQSAWARTSVFAPRHDWYGFAEKAGRLLRDTMASLSAMDLVPGEWADEADDESEQQIEQAKERIAATFESSDPQNVLRALGEWLDELKSKTKYKEDARNLLLNVIAGLLVLMLQIMAFPPNAPQSSVVVVKKVKMEAVRIRKEGVGFPAEIRVVIASVLKVHSEASRESRTVGRLYAGDMVSVTRTRTRSWSLVEFEDQEGEIVLRGWVFTRYIVPLRGSRLHPRRRR